MQAWAKPSSLFQGLTRQFSVFPVEPRAELLTVMGGGASATTFLDRATNVKMDPK